VSYEILEIDSAYEEWQDLEMQVDIITSLIARDNLSPQRYDYLVNEHKVASRAAQVAWDKLNQGDA
jgi:hypothetical protein